jgi:hypothetical protein
MGRARSAAALELLLEGLTGSVEPDRGVVQRDAQLLSHRGERLFL